MSELDAARSLFPGWLVWAPLLSNTLLASLASYVAVRLTGLATPKRAWTDSAMPWPERARAVYPCRRAAGLVAMVAAILFAITGWNSGGTLLPAPRWAFAAASFLAAYTFAHWARFHLERRVWPGLTIGSYARGVGFQFFTWGWLLLPAAVVFLLAGTEIDLRWAGACAVGLVVAIVAGRMGMLRGAALFGFVREADARLNAIVERASQQAGAYPDWIGILRVPAANAFADPIHGHVVFTSRALASMSDQDIQAIALHELGHLEQGRSFRQLRAGGIVLLTVLGSSWLLWTQFGARGLLPLFALSALYIAFVHKRQKHGEEGADRHAHQHELEAESYAIALGRIYELNSIPAVLGQKLAVHRDLYDRQLAAGYQPNYPRPRKPSLMRYLFVTVVASAFLIAAVTAFMVAVPRATAHVAPPLATGGWVVQSPSGYELFFSAWAATEQAPNDVMTMVKAVLASDDAQDPDFLSFVASMQGSVPCSLAEPIIERLELRFGELSSGEPCIDGESHSNPADDRTHQDRGTAPSPQPGTE